jgi:predicted outer membrane protein
MKRGRWCGATTLTMLVLPLALGTCRGRESGADRGSLDGFVETAAALTDAGIIAILDEASLSDSVAAALAAEKATDAGVKAFATSAMEDHHALRVDGARLVKTLGLTPRLPASDPLSTVAEDEMIALRATPRGPEFDRVYIEKEVATRQAVKDFSEQAKRATPNDQIRSFIDRVTSVIERHLERAQALRNGIARTA